MLYLSPGNVLQVPKGHVWLEGDQPGRSYDSRHFGPLPVELIWGRVFFRVHKDSNLGSSLIPKLAQFVRPLKQLGSLELRQPQSL